MSSLQLGFTLSYTGDVADDHEIDFYDVAQGLIGFQRSLALTTHLVLNGEVITQAPALKGAELRLIPPRQGSWEVTAILTVLVTGAYKLGTAPKDTPLGHLMYSAYDYVISEILGFHVDYDKTLGQQYEEKSWGTSQIPILDQTRFDSVIEKCEPAIENMHRPIVRSTTASKAQVSHSFGKARQLISHPLTPSTYEYIHHTETTERPVELFGKVSSYNINTYKGRVFVNEERRPIPFELGLDARDVRTVIKVTQSLSSNARSRFESGSGDLWFKAFKTTSRSGRLKKLIIVEILEDFMS